MRTMTKKLLAVGFATALTTGGATILVGCSEGPAERAGEVLDGKSSTAKDKLTPDGPAEEAGKKVDRAVE
jgi:hypothetical protein